MRALLSLAIGSFGIGMTEFVVMGLLPNIAGDLLPTLWASSPEDALSQAGWLISLYALGVVIGAPTIAGFVARYPRHRVMIVPSISAEGFGIVALEGLACGCRMLVSDAGGLPEAVGQFGAVFPMGDVQALTNLLEECLANPEVEAMSEAKMAYLQDHRAQNVARKYLDVFAGAAWKQQCLR